MRETVGEWKQEWIETNGQTDELEVVIRDDEDAEIYAGSFQDIPEKFASLKVSNSGRILDSSIPERCGAYTLRVGRENRLDNLINRAEQIVADQKLTAQRKDVQLSEIMTDMEREYKIPMLHDQEFEAGHPEVIKTYRKISDMRSL